MTDKTMREKIAEDLIAYSYWLTSHYESVGQNALEADRRAGAFLALKVDGTTTIQDLIENYLAGTPLTAKIMKRQMRPPLVIEEDRP